MHDRGEPGYRSTANGIRVPVAVAGEMVLQYCTTVMIHRIRCGVYARDYLRVFRVIL